MRGNLLDLSIGMNNRQRITVEISGDFREEFDRLKDVPINIEIKKHYNKRSLDANAYAWTLIDKIAEVQRIDRTTVYRDTIREIGGVSDMVCIQEDAAENLCKMWESRGLGWQTQVVESKLQGCVNVVLYYGSSQYDTKQMSSLIEQLVHIAQGLGIPTDTPEEIARYTSMENGG